MWYFLLCSYLAWIAIVYYFSGALFWIVSPAITYVKNIHYKHIRISKFRFYLNLFKRGHKLLVFHLSNISITINIDDLTQKTSHKKSNKKKQNTRQEYSSGFNDNFNTLKHKLLKLSINSFPGFEICFFDVNLVFISSSQKERLMIIVPEFKLNSDLRQIVNNISKPKSRKSWLVDHRLHIKDLNIKVSSKTKSLQFLKNLAVDINYSVNSSNLKILDICLNFYNERLDFPIFSILKYINEFIPQEIKKHILSSKIYENRKENVDKRSNAEKLKQQQSDHEQQLNDFMDKISLALAKANEVLNMFKEVNINLSNLNIDEIYLFLFFLTKENYFAAFDLIENGDAQFLNQIYFQCKLNKFNVNLNKLNKNSPGYELLFSVNDNPVQFIASLMNFQVLMHVCNVNDKKNIKPFVLELFQIPNINFTIQTNSLYQTLKVLLRNKKITSAVIKVSSHMSSPTIEFNSFYFGVLLLNFRQIKYFFKDNLVFESQQKAQKEHEENYIVNFFYSSISRFLPLLFFKITIEDIIFLIKYPDKEANSLRTVSLNINFVGFETYTRKKLFNNNKNITHTSILNKLDISGIKGIYQQHKDLEYDEDKSTVDASDSDSDTSSNNHSVNDDFSYVNEDILYSEFATLKLSFEGLPNMSLLSSFFIQTLYVDLSNLSVLTGLSTIVEDIYSTTHYFYLSNDELEKYANERKVLDNHLIPPKHRKDANKSLEEIKKVYKAYLFSMMPEWLHETKFFGNDLTIIMGSRSILIPQELLKHDFLSENDKIQNSLRKIIYKLDSWSISLNNSFANENHDLRSFSTTAAASSIGETSISNFQEAANTPGPEEEESDSSGPNESQDVYWEVDFNFKDIVIDILACDPRLFKKNFDKSRKAASSKKALRKSSRKNHYRLMPINVLMVPIIESKLSSLHSEDGKGLDFLKLSTHISEIEFKYSTFAHFVILSSISFLKNVMLAFSLHDSNLKPSKNEGEKAEKASPKFKLTDLLLVETAVNSIDTILYFPLDFKMRVQLQRLQIVSPMYSTELSASAELLRICVQSPTIKKYWERLMIVNNLKFIMDFKRLEQFNKNKYNESFKNDEAVFQIEFVSSRVSVPFNFIIHNIFDNIGIIKKIFKQINYSLKNNSPEIVLRPTYIERPPAIPKFEIRANRFMFNMDDDPFESQLNSAYQIGLAEQRERMSKIEFFIQEVQSKYLVDKPYMVEITAAFSLIISDSKYVYFAQEGKVFKKPRYSDDNNQWPTVSHNKNLIDAFAKIEILQRNLTKSWVKRVKWQKAKFNEEIQSRSEYLWKLTKVGKYSKNFDKRVWDGIFLGPPLLSSVIENLSLTISSVDFPLLQIPEYLHQIGKGMPLDMKYQMLVPLYLDLRFNELRGHLRDYPLPFIHMPSNEGSSEAIRISGNIIILEEFTNRKENIKKLFIPLVPSCEQVDQDPYYSLTIPKTLASVKTFLNLKIDVSSSKATRFTWGASYQPAVQQIMLNFDGFTKPQLDPSDKVGFWDKLRANIHGRVACSWSDKGALDIVFKGGRDPYKVLDKDDGFILSFSENIALDINKNDDPKEFIVVNANKISWIAPNHVAQPLLVWSRGSKDAVFVPALKNFNPNSLAGFYLASDDDTRAISPQLMAESEKNYYEKTAINLSGNVIFIFGVLFERKLSEKRRTDEFIPHYKVQLTNPDFVKEKNYDAYEGFRSHFIHMAFSLKSLDSKGTKSYNSFHLSPNVFSSFFLWWKLFSGNMSLPIRHGRIFGPAKASKKFSIYLSTIKFQFLLSPLYVCHVYRDKVSSTVKQGSQAADSYSSFNAIGVKGRVDNVKIDLHQRKQPTIVHKKILDTTKRIMKMKFNIGEVDIENIDVRLINATFDSNEKFLKPQLKIFDNNTSWYDINDFEELFLPSIKSLKPLVQVYPVMFSPRMMYFRRTAEEEALQDETQMEIPFGNEPSHVCVLSEKHSSIDAQLILTKMRIQELKQQVAFLEKKSLSKVHDGQDDTWAKNIEELKARLQEVEKNFAILRSIKNNSDDPEISEPMKKTVMLQDTDYEVKFNNRFIIHNMLLKWNCNNRNLIFKYVHLLTLHKAINYFMGTDALSSITDIIENKLNVNELESSKSFNSNFQLTDVHENLSNAKSANGNGIGKYSGQCSNSLDSFDQDLRFVTSNALFHNDDYLLKLVSPQIQLIDDDSSKACLLVVAPSIELKVISIKQKRYKAGKDDLSETLEYSDVVETRFGSLLHEANIFAFYKESVFEYSSLYFASESYGSNTIWPPWLGVELCTNGTILRDNMMLEKTSMLLRYDRVGNTLQADESVEDLQKRRNRIIFDVPKVIVSCDSKQYTTLYSLAWDLLIYSEPSTKELSSKLEKLAMKTSLSNLSELLARIRQLQKEIRILGSMERVFIIKKQFLSHRELFDLSIIRLEREELLKDLYTSMKAIALGGENNKSIGEQVEWAIRADSIICHMLVKNREPLIDIALSKSQFKRKEASDGSNENILQIAMMQGFTLSADTYYQEMFLPFNYEDKLNSAAQNQTNLINVKWSMKKPIGGIKVMKYLHIFLQPIKLQLDQDTGKQIFEYVFNEEYKKRDKYGKKDAKNGNETSQSLHKDKNGKLEHQYTDTEEKEVDFDNANDFDDETAELVKQASSVIEEGLPFDDVNNTNAVKIGNHAESDDFSDSSSRGSKRKKSNGYFATNESERHHSDDNNGSHRSFKTRSQNNGTTKKLSEENIDLGESNSDDFYGKKDDDAEDEDGVDLMLKRASKNFNIESFKLDSCILCISYKGEGRQRLISVNNFVIKLPTIIISRQILSFYEISMLLKKIVLKSLLQHSGKLIGNKLKSHKLKRIKQPLIQLTNYDKFVSVQELKRSHSMAVSEAEVNQEHENVEFQTYQPTKNSLREPQILDE